MTLMQSVGLELMKAILAGFVAASVFVLGQILVRFVFDPVVELRKLLAQIRDDFLEYEPAFHQIEAVIPEFVEKARRTYRSHGISLLTFSHKTTGIPFYEQLAKPLGLPCRKQAADAARSFIGISNTSPHPTHEHLDVNQRHFENIGQLRHKIRRRRPTAVVLNIVDIG